MIKKQIFQKGWFMTKIKSLLSAALFAAAAISLQAAEGEMLFKKNCVSCHIDTMPNMADRSSFVAPPVFGVMFHVKEKYKSREDAVAFIVDYIMEPSKEKAVCLERTIKRFGLMPSMKGVVTEEEAKKIAGYMYDSFPPSGFAQKRGKCGPKGCAGGGCSAK